MNPSTQGNQLLRLMVFVALSVALMFFDQRTEQLKFFRHTAGLAAKPVQDLAGLPASVRHMYELFTDSRLKLYNQNKTLRQDNLSLRAKLQRLESLEAENTRLSKLLSASRRFDDRTLMARMLEISLDPYTHRVLIDRGKQDGVYEGQPVIDSRGIMGQVTEATHYRSVVTLITDPGQAVPVQVQRTGLRTIVHGNGDTQDLRVANLGRNANIRKGDFLVTSGMGGRFPPGYPVARVTEVIKDANEAFLGISAQPVAQLDHSSEVLLIWFEHKDGEADSFSDLALKNGFDGNNTHGF